MKDRIRIHQYITKNIKSLTTSNYTPREIQANIELYGVDIDNTMYFKRLEKVFGNEDISIAHWPIKEKASYDGIAIIWEDADYLVLFKPFGLPVQKGAGHLDNNLVNWLLDNIPGQKELLALPSNENNSITAGLVHRLDKDTQGLILIAKNLPALIHAQNQFRQRFVSKTYLTVLNGVLEEEITIEGHQFREPKTLIKQVFVTNNLVDITKKQYGLDDNKVKECKSTITPLLTDGINTFCKVKIYTGRMHQIRVAAQAIGHTVLNDKLYNNQQAKLSEIDLSRFLIEDLEPKKISSQKLDTITHDVFKGHKYCLLSNELIFKDLNNKEVINKLKEY
jgi:23S rRNA-/tRNA-specific pseudouridylate synthase